MARNRTTNDLLREWRGDMKLDRAAVYASDHLGFDISRETIRRYESLYREDQMDPLVIVALLRVYGKAISDLPEVAQERVRKAQDLLKNAIGWTDIFAA